MASASKRTSLRRLARHGGKRYELERCLGNFLVSAANSYSDAHPAPTLPPFPECYTAEALALGPVRCATGQCPSDFALRRPYPGGCELTDRAGVSTPPPEWRYARGENQCMAVGCRG